MAVHIQKSSLPSAINASALIDIAFQLIIFFVVVARFDPANKELPVALPQASAAAPLSFKPKELIISVSKAGQMAVSADKQGHIVEDKMLVTPDQLDQVLQQVSVNNAGRQAVKVRADKLAMWQNVVGVMNACQKAGIRDYEVQTDGGP
ncbi:MAG TPA: biopolymer transporter ExbD [Pirellulales bacterium]|jgi:biopolymer transport protein ExbD|nr:biopolymer transporter ExbD [Pirellulales bacterium]